MIWGDRSVGEVLVAQTRGPVFKPQIHVIKKQGTVLLICTPNAKEMQRGGTLSPLATSPDESLSSTFSGRSCLKKYNGTWLRSSANINLWHPYPSHMHTPALDSHSQTYMNMCVYTHACPYRYKPLFYVFNSTLDNYLISYCHSYLHISQTLKKTHCNTELK